MNNAYSAYKKQSITTMTPVEIVIKLYSECERQLNRAVHFIEMKNFEETNKALIKAQDIVNALRSVLDMKIELSKSLDSLYEYFNRQILTANLKKDAELIKAIVPMVGELKNAFVQISQMSREEIAAQDLENRMKGQSVS